jgi:hypothetical protein
MLSLMELGLSRISSRVLTSYTTNRDMDVATALAWVRRQNYATMDVPAICMREIRPLLLE